MSSVPHAGLQPVTAEQPRIWTWWVAALLGFPIGGYAANLIAGAVDSVGPAIAGGLSAGAVVGGAQWFVLRRVITWHWIAATSLGLAAGLALGAALVDYGVDRPELMAMGAVSGLVVGALQAAVLAARDRTVAIAWLAASPATWALAWLISSYVISATIDERFTNFGASGTLLYALVTSVVLAWLFRRTSSAT
jgi:hypothetical protein